MHSSTLTYKSYFLNAALIISPPTPESHSNTTFVGGSEWFQRQLHNSSCCSKDCKRRRRNPISNRFCDVIDLIRSIWGTNDFFSNSVDTKPKCFTIASYITQVIYDEASRQEKRRAVTAQNDPLTRNLLFVCTQTGNHNSKQTPSHKGLSNF